MNHSNRVTSARWHLEEKDQVHETLAQVWRVVRDNGTWRTDADVYHAGLYGGGAASMTLRQVDMTGYSYGGAAMPHNVCRGATDTLVAKVAKHRPLPQVLTNRGDWRAKKRGKKLTQLIEGAFYTLRIFETWAHRVVRDACIFGRGAMYFWREGKRLRAERVHVWELYVDAWDAHYGEPRNLYRVRSADRGVLFERFAKGESKERREEIREALESATGTSLLDDSETETSPSVDRVDVVEAWHLCDDENAHADPSETEEHECTGRHVVCVAGATLLDEPWTRASFPIPILSYNEPLTGVFGQGLVEQLEGFQTSINYSTERLEEMHRQSGVLIATPIGSEIVDAEVRNGVGNLITHKPGAPPQVIQIDLVNEHVRARPRELREDALNDAGLSEMSVQSQKPAGIESGIALQTLDDIESERFIIFGRQYEAWCLEVSRQIIECIRDIVKEFGDFSAAVPIKGGMLPLNWKDVYVDGFELRIFPAALLPSQPAARMQRLVELFDKGIVDRSTFLRELGAPDLAAELDTETADKLNVDERIEVMLDAEEDEGEEKAYKPPTAYQDLAWAAKRAQQRLNQAETDGAPEFNLALLRNFIDDCEELIGVANPANDAAMASPGGAPAPPPPDAGAPLPPGEPMLAPVAA